MPRILLPVLLASIFCLLQCKPEHEEQPGYSMAIGEKLEISYPGNKAGAFSIINQASLRHIQFVEEKRISKTEGSGDSAFVFKGTSEGTDTVWVQSPLSDTDGYEQDVETKKYVITVR